jgi:hypothetical protein
MKYLKIELEDYEEEVKELEAGFTQEILALDKEFAEKQASMKRPEPPKNIVPYSSVEEQEANEETEEKKPSKEKRSKDQKASLPNEQVAIEEEIEECPESMKKLWKSIAMVSHPDKTEGDDEATSLYKKAVAAWRDKSYEDLLDIAIDLNVKLPDPDQKLLDTVVKKCSTISDRIKKIEGSVFWVWGHAPQDKKDQIVKLFLAQRAAHLAQAKKS